MLKNKSAEKDIRDFLTGKGYFGRTARFEELELHAIQRPGWLQVFRFSVRAKSRSDEWELLFGAMKDDERFQVCKIMCFSTTAQRDVVLSRWSEGLTTPKYGASAGSSFGVGRTISELLIFSAIIAAVIGLLSLLS